MREEDDAQERVGEAQREADRPARVEPREVLRRDARRRPFAKAHAAQAREERAVEEEREQHPEARQGMRMPIAGEHRRDYPRCRGDRSRRSAAVARRRGARSSIARIGIRLPRGGRLEVRRGEAARVRRSRARRRASRGDRGARAPSRERGSSASLVPLCGAIEGEGVQRLIAGLRGVARGVGSIAGLAPVRGQRLRVLARRCLERQGEPLAARTARAWVEPGEDGLADAIMVRLDRVDPPRSARTDAVRRAEHGDAPAELSRLGVQPRRGGDDLLRDRLSWATATSSAMIGAPPGSRCARCATRSRRRASRRRAPSRRARRASRAPRRTAGARRPRARSRSRSAGARPRPLEEGRGLELARLAARSRFATSRTRDVAAQRSAQARPSAGSFTSRALAPHRGEEEEGRGVGRREDLRERAEPVLVGPLEVVDGDDRPGSALTIRETSSRSETKARFRSSCGQATWRRSARTPCAI